MLSVLLAVTAATSPVGVERVALTPCAPDKHTACLQPARRNASGAIPAGKRCHPDPTKSFACREWLSENDRPKDQSRDEKVVRVD